MTKRSVALGNIPKQPFLLVNFQYLVIPPAEVCVLASVAIYMGEIADLAPSR